MSTPESEHPDIRRARQEAMDGHFDPTMQPAPPAEKPDDEQAWEYPAVTNGMGA